MDGQPTSARAWKLACSSIAVLTYAFLLLPILTVLPLAFSSGTFLSYPLPGLSLRWFHELLTGYKWTLALENSLIVGTGAAAISTVVGVAAAIAINGIAPRLRGVLYGLLLAPIVVPVIILAVALFLSFSELGITGSRWGLILAHACIGAPYVVITVSASLRNFDFTLIRAAIGLGASPFMAYRRVMFPIIQTAILAGTLFAFVASFDEVVIVLFLAGPEQMTLPIRLFEGIRDDLNPVVIAAAAVMILVSVGLMLAVEALRRRAERKR